MSSLPIRWQRLVNYNAHVLNNVVGHLAPELGWRWRPVSRGG